MASDLDWVKAGDRRVVWQGHVSLEPVGGFGGALKPWRIPFADRSLFPGVVERAEMPSGVRLSIVTDSRRLAIRGAYQVEDPNFNRPAQARVGRVGNEVIDVPTDGTIVNLPGDGEREVSVWLPQVGTMVVDGLGLEAGATVTRPDDDERPRWITYGSSITHCAEANGPLRTWAARVANEAGLNLTNLGYAGQCLLDPMVARLIRDLPADYISVCCGINIYGDGGFSQRTLPAAIIGTIELLREGHPDVPLCLISPIFSPPREQVASNGLTLVDFRRIIARVVKLLRDRGDESLHYVDGLSIFGPDSIPAGAAMADLLPDELHPNDAAQPVVAANVMQHVVRGAFGLQED